MCYLLQDSADAFSGSIFVVLGVPGQQFQDSLSAVRQPGEHICEGAAPIDGKVEFPLGFGHSEEREELILGGVREEGEISYISALYYCTNNKTELRHLFIHKINTLTP